MNNTLWQIETLKTRRQMRAAAWRYWMKAMVEWWVVTTLVVLVLSLSWSSEEQKRNIVPWVMASAKEQIPLPLPFFRTAWWQGLPYDPDVLASHLSTHVYHGRLVDWLLWAAGTAVLPVVLIGTCRLSRKGTPNVQHLRGAEILSVKELQRRIGKQKGITIAGVTIPEALRTRHFLICGSTGSGKTVTIRQMLRQYASRGEHVVVVDVEGELTAEFYDKSRGDVLLNQLDARGSWWDIVKECESAAALKTVAASLFPVTPDMADAAIFYHRAARRVFVKEMSRLLATRRVDPRELLEVMEESLHKQKKTSLLATVENGLDSFEYLAPVDGPGWTAREWVENPCGWCFLTTRESEKETTLPHLSLFLDLLTRRILSGRRNPKQILSVVIDEVAALRVQPQLQELGNRGRKRGVSLTLGFQNHSQLAALYGTTGVVDLLDPPATRILLQANNYETQEWCAKQIGEREMRRMVERETAGSADMRDSIHRGPEQKVEEAVLSSQFKQLKMQGYIGVDSYGWALIDVPQVYGVERQPDFIPRKDEVAGPDLTQIINAPKQLIPRRVSPKRRAV